MTFGVRPSCVATLRCGSSLARLEIQCLHQERNTTCVSSCMSNSSAVVQVEVFVLLQLGCLRCLAQWDLQMLEFLVSSPQSRDSQQSVQLVQLVVHVSAPSFVALASSQLSEDPSRTFDSHVSVQYSQLVSMVSRRKPKHPMEKIPPSSSVVH